MIFKLLGSFFIIIFIITSGLYAQENSSYTDDMINRMKKSLQLTDIQVDALIPVIKNYGQKREAIIQTVEQEGIVDHVAVKESLKLLKQKEYQQLSKILSPQQLAKWIQKENLRASLNQGEGTSQVEDDTIMTANGASFKF